MQKKRSDRELVEMLYNKSNLALAFIFETFSGDLLNYFTKKYNNIDKEDICSIITDSMIKLTDSPEKYDKNKSSLKTYLIRDINGDILNFIDKNKRKRNQLSIVALDDRNGNIQQEYNSEIEDQEIQIRGFFNRVFNNNLDCQLAWLIEIEKERETKKYIEVLKIVHLTNSQQQDAVKKQKDRIQVQLKRKGWKEFLKTLQ